MYPHIKKYLAGKTSIEPFKVTTHNMYGTILFLSLEQKPKEHEKPLDFGDFMEIRIPKWHSDKHGPCISNKKIDIFNETVQRMMLHELKVELDTGNKKVGDIKRIIFDFRERYGILDTELDYMNLRRQYTRQLEAEKKVNIFPKNLPQFMSYGFYVFAGLLTPIISVLSFDVPLL